MSSSLERRRDVEPTVSSSLRSWEARMRQAWAMLELVFENEARPGPAWLVNLARVMEAWF